MSGKRLSNRRAADPIGLRGLPATRAELDNLAGELCGRLRIAGSGGIRSRQLVEELGLTDTRALRLLVAYARVHHHRHEILGVPGNRYYWGPVVPKLVSHVIADCERRARCYFFIAALHRREGTAMAAVQLMFDWFDTNVPAGSRRADDLAALTAAEGVGVSDVLDAFLERLAASTDGQKILAEAGRKHAAVLLPAELLRRLAGKLEQARAELLAAARRAG